MYSGDSHFVLELLQNADDCSYADGIVPALVITIVDDQLKFGEYTSFSTKQLGTR